MTAVLAEIAPKRIVLGPLRESSIGKTSALQLHLDFAIPVSQSSRPSPNRPQCTSPTRILRERCRGAHRDAEIRM